MLPRKIFENSHVVVAILVLFERILGKFCLSVLPLILSVSQIYDAFCLYIFDYAYLRSYGVKLIVIEKVQSYGKTVFIKNMFENGW